MKKLALIMTLVMVAALAAVPAHAGLSTDITGKVAGEIMYKDGRFQTKGTVTTKIALSAGSEGAIRAVVNLAAFEAKSEDKAFGGAFTASNALNLKVNSAYVETTGAWFKGAPETTTKLGRFESNYNDWVAAIAASTTNNGGNNSAAGKNQGDSRGTEDGLEIAGLDLGGVGLTAYAGWVDLDSSGDADARVGVISGSTTLDVIDVSGALVRTAISATDISYDFAVEAGIAPSDDVSVTVEYASDGVNKGTAYKISGEVASGSDLTFNGKFWNTSDTFNPRFARWEDGDDSDSKLDNPTKFTTDQAGYEVGVKTTQSGVDLGLTYNHTTKADGKTDPVTTTTFTAGTVLSETDVSGKVVNKSTEANPKIEVEAKRSFGDINGSYKLVREHDTKITHTVKADTTVDTVLADGVKLEGKVELPQGADSKIDLDASWQAPNGFKLGLHYANYNNGDYGKDFSARMGVEVQF